MVKALVLYKSIYGSTARYAEWIAEALGCDAVPLDKTDASRVEGCDLVVYGGGLYAGGIAGMKKAVKLLRAAPARHIVVFTTGLSDPEHTDYTEIEARSCPADLAERVHFFHLRGAMDYAQLRFPHNIMMKMLKTMVEKKKDKTEEDMHMLETFGGNPDFCEKATIEPLVEYVKGLR